MPGLGCGAIIAPVLARLESVKGRGTVEVDRSGSYVRVRPATLLTEVVEVLGKSGAAAQPLSAAETAEVLAWETRWYTRENVRELTREEFKVLVRRWSKELKDKGDVTADEERRLVAGLDDAVDSAVETLPTKGTPRTVRPGVRLKPTHWRSSCHARAIGCLKPRWSACAHFSTSRRFGEVLPRSAQVAAGSTRRTQADNEREARRASSRAASYALKYG